MTRCHYCNTPFDAVNVVWCECDRPARTLRCANCGRCFCQAPLLYQRRFWSDAPRSLREHLNRFREQIASLAPRIEPDALERRPSILIVDDDEAMRSIVACFVEQLGYRALAVDDPEKALSQAAVYPFDLVITDALMPRLDGRELCRRLKALPDGASRKVILMSSLYKSLRARTEAYSFGIDDFLPKPIDFNMLGALLDRHVPVRKSHDRPVSAQSARH